MQPPSVVVQFLNGLKTSVEKNQKGFVNVIFNSKGISGSFTKSIYVKSNADNDVVILKIIGEVVNKKEKSIFNIFNIFK